MAMVVHSAKAICAKTIMRHAPGASEDIRAIHQANLQPDQKDILEGLFFSLLLQRFPEKSNKEIRKMIDFGTPVEEPVFYKEVFHEGQITGKIEDQINSLGKEICRSGRPLRR